MEGEKFKEYNNCDGGVWMETLYQFQYYLPIGHEFTGAVLSDLEATLSNSHCTN